MKTIIILLVIFMLSWYGFKHFNEGQWQTSESPAAYTQSVEYSKCTTADGHVVYGQPLPGVECEKIENIQSAVTVVPGQKASSGSSGKTLKFDSKPSVFKGKYHCDGRTYCSEMTSCEEAKFFLLNCPNVEMDGDGDDVPCERQLCS